MTNSLLYSRTIYSAQICKVPRSVANATQSPGIACSSAIELYIRGDRTSIANTHNYAVVRTC